MLKVYCVRGRSLVKIWPIWFTLFIGLLHVSLLQSPAVATASHLRGGGFATNPYLYRIFESQTLSDFENGSLWLFYRPHLVACYIKFSYSWKGTVKTFYSAVNYKFKVFRQNILNNKKYFQMLICHSVFSLKQKAMLKNITRVEANIRRGPGETVGGRDH